MIREQPLATVPMTTRRLFLSVLAIAFVGLLGITTSFAQDLKEPSQPKIWFIARVIEVQPFTLEYVDDWYRHQKYGGGVGFGIDVNPHSRNENVGRFKIGDLIAGEFCYVPLGNCPPSTVRASEEFDASSESDGIRLPPTIAINLRKLNGRHRDKYARAGNLIQYKLPENSLVRSLHIYRDGLVTIDTHASGGTSARLSLGELRQLENAFVESRSDRIGAAKANVFDASLLTVFGKLRTVWLDPVTNGPNSFFGSLQKIIERLLDRAEYRITYRWRFKITDWQYGNVFPLDEAAKPGYEFIVKNRDRLSLLRPPEHFYEDAKERQGEVAKFFYRFKGKLYGFSFATCTDRATGSWGCFFANEVGKRDGTGKLFAAFDEWPEKLGVSLDQIPEEGRISSHQRLGNGVAIPSSDFALHRKFYSQFLRSNGSFREGDFVYVDVTIWFK